MNKTTYTASRCRNSTSIKVIAGIFMRAVIVSETLTFTNFELENVRQGQRVQLLNHAIIDCKYHCLKSHNRIFAVALTVSKMLTFRMFDLENLGQGHVEQHSP